jgi:hypothetical protein
MRFGSNDISVMGDYHALRMINERFCRIARSVFLPMLRIQPRISAFPAETRSFDDYRNSQDNFVSLTNTRIEELRGQSSDRHSAAVHQPADGCLLWRADPVCENREDEFTGQNNGLSRSSRIG